MREQLSKMVKGECVTVENLEFRDIVTGFASRDNILTYLIHLGYLTYDWNSKKAFIPNEDVRGKVRRMVGSPCRKL